MEKAFEIYITTTPERLWKAITDPELRSKYNFGSASESQVVADGEGDFLGVGRPISRERGGP